MANNQRKPKKLGSKGPSPKTTDIRKYLKEAKKKLEYKKSNPMKMERKKEGFRAKNPGVRFRDEMEAVTKGLDTLTSKGTGKVKLAFKGGGRAYGQNS